MKVGQPAFDRIGIGAGDALAGRRVDYRRAGRAVVEPERGDPARRRAPDLLHPRIGSQDTSCEIGDGQPGLGLRRGKPLGRGKDRERRAAQRKGHDENEGQQTRPAMQRADHGVASHVVAEAGDIPAAGRRLSRSCRRQRHGDVLRAVAHVLDGGVDMQRIARIEQRIGKVEGDFE
nr:hypothetical protein RKHAN_04053 [Rhizobium sp. Khangiran2]